MLLKKSCLILLFITFSLGMLAAAPKKPGKFVDSVTGISFKIPDGWTQARKQYPPLFLSDRDKEIQDYIILEKYFRDVPVEEAYEKYWEHFKKSFEDLALVEKKEIELKDRKAILIYYSYTKVKKEGGTKRITEKEFSSEAGKLKKSFMLFIKTGSIINIVEFFNNVMPGDEAGKLLETLAGTISFETAPKVVHSLFSPRGNDVEELLEKKKYEEAEKLADKALIETPGDPELLMLKAVLSASLNKEADAVKFVEEAFSQGYFDPSYVTAKDEFKEAGKKGLFNNFIKNRNELIKKGRKVLLARVKKELASYYEIQIPETNVILYTDIKDNAKIKILKESMVTAAKFASDDLEIKKSEFPIFWIMSESRDVNKALIGTLMGTSSGFEGVYVPAFGIFFSDTATGYGTFVHEYMHALHSGDQNLLLQNHPRWLTEMLSTTFESLRWNEVREKIEVKYKSERLGSLLFYIRNDKHVGLDKLITAEKGWNKNIDIEIFYAAVRYLGIYLYSELLLPEFYSEYKKNYEEDKSGLKAFEKVTGKNIADFEKEWEKWLPVINKKD